VTGVDEDRNVLKSRLSRFLDYGSGVGD